MSLKLGHVQLAMKYIQLLLPVAERRMGRGSTFFKETQKIERNLGILLQSLLLDVERGQTRIVNYTPSSYEELKKSVKNLKNELNLAKDAAVYRFIEGPTKQLLTQVEIIIKKIPS